MSKKIYVGNLPYSVNDSALEGIFSEIGTVESAKVVTDRDTGRSKGFGFVEMSTEQEAEAAIDRFNGTEYEGRTLKVAAARPREPRGFGGGYR